MLQETSALMLRTVKYGDDKMIADMLTARYGRLSFITPLPKTVKAKMKRPFFQPLTLLEIIFDYRVNAQLQRIKDVRLKTPFLTISQHPAKLAIALFLTEFLYYATRHEQGNPQLFAYIENSLLWLDSKEKDFANFHLVFMMRLSRFLGFYPNLEQSSDGSRFDLRVASFIDTPPLHADVLSTEESSKIKLLMRMNFDTMHLFAMNRAERNRICDVLIEYYRLHTPNFPVPKSLPVLKDLF